MVDRGEFTSRKEWREAQSDDSSAGREASLNKLLQQIWRLVVDPFAEEEW